MTITEAHYDFKIKQNRIASLSNMDFNPAQIDWLLNEAQMMFIKQRFTVFNPHRMGFEASQKRIDDLSTLVVKYPTQQMLIPTEVSPGIYELKTSFLTFKYLFFLGGYVDATVLDNCNKEIPLKFIQNDDYREALRDPFNSPSLEFIPYNFGISTTDNVPSLYIYSGSYTINSIKPEYIRYPNKVNLGTYVYIDGITYPPTEFSVPEQTHSEIVDIAVNLAALHTDNPELVQLRSQKILMHE